MKNIVKIVVSVLIATFATSCVPRLVPANQPMAVRPMGQQPYGMPPMGPPQPGFGGGKQTRKLESVTVKKVQTGHFEAQVMKSRTDADRQRVALYAASFYEKNGRGPSEAELTRHFGFPARARMIDTPDKVVGSVTVRPNEVPANIRAKFQ